MANSPSSQTQLPNEQDFRGPPPPWGDVRDATHQSRVAIGFFKDRAAWKMAAPEMSEHALRIQGHPVMEDWEEPYMRALAQIATRQGGTVLELGYGLGISARYIQQRPIERHIIVEANHIIAEQARAFGRVALYPVTVLEGFWEEVMDQIPDASVDGILFDTYPLSELEVHKNHFGFFRAAYQKLRPNGVFTYYSDEIDDFSPLHRSKLIAAGFTDGKISGEVVPVRPPEDCEYWTSPTILAPIIVK